MANAVLCGSVNLATREDVFRMVASIAGTSIKRISDGETGDRARWTDAQIPRLAAMAQLEPADTPGLVKTAFRLRDGVDASELRFDFGYADAAIESYQVFAALKDDGVIAPETRFQVSLPTVTALTMYIDPSDLGDVWGVMERDALEQVDTIAAAIAHDQLAIQWDVAAEIAVVEDYLPNPTGETLADLYDAVARLGAAIPADIELGYHLCYGDEPGDDGLGHHFMEPTDTAKLVTFANELTQRTPRAINWIHMPVPISRDDDAYYAPLANLRLAPHTELYLGLVHHEDGIEGAQRRIDTAAKYTKNFGVATECGMGRETPDNIPKLLHIQRDAQVPT